MPSPQMFIPPFMRMGGEANGNGEASIPPEAPPAETGMESPMNNLFGDMAQNMNMAHANFIQGFTQFMNQMNEMAPHNFLAKLMQGGEIKGLMSIPPLEELRVGGQRTLRSMPVNGHSSQPPFEELANVLAGKGGEIKGLMSIPPLDELREGGAVSPALYQRLYGIQAPEY